MYLNVSQLVGENAMTLHDGEQVFRSIHDPLLHGDTVELDFEGVRVFASPFFNAGIGALLQDLPAEALKSRLKIAHISDSGARVMRRVIDNAKEFYSSSSAHREAISTIATDTGNSMR